jgi:hypothetical protein
LLNFPKLFFGLEFSACELGLGSKKVDISRTSFFLHEIPDKMLGFLHITDPVLPAGSDKTKIKPPSIIVKEIQAGSQDIRVLCSQIP